MNAHSPTIERPPAERSGETIIPPDMQPDLPGIAETVAAGGEEKDDRPEFDWFTDDSVLLGEQLATAVYRNRAAEAVRLLVGALLREAEGDG